MLEKLLVVLILSGYLLEHEKEKLERIDLSYDKYWVPINWAKTLVVTARKNNKTSADILTNKLMEVCNLDL